jgi:hypothetical protein
MKSPIDLVQASTISTFKKSSWIDKLTPIQQGYIHSVVKVMREHTSATPRGVAIALKRELDLAAGLTTISETLRKMCNEKEKS